MDGVDTYDKSSFLPIVAFDSPEHSGSMETANKSSMWNNESWALIEVVLLSTQRVNNTHPMNMNSTILLVIRAPLLAGLSIPNMANTSGRGNGCGIVGGAVGVAQWKEDNKQLL